MSAVGSNGSPRRGTLGPGNAHGIFEEMEDGSTFPASAIDPTVAAVADGTQNRCCLSGGARQHILSRNDDSVQQYADCRRTRDQKNGMLSPIARELDRKLDRNMVDHGIAQGFDSKILALLDRLKEPDRPRADSIGSLDREVECWRDLRPEKKTKELGIRVRPEGEDETGLKTDVDRLRMDMRKLMTSPPVMRCGNASKDHGGGAFGGTTVVS
ncbi:hypothetical protein M406DRAFT_326987 [Cryphonectria parasitica EP155]|uniref:Uncharacterized protein n=1 Tax=Cryphonectria parasitica (strain ATCC 38755 / EP155) TaxID=660469 RepID=A0A9P5CSG3_CRYP1|nr:uncharacterized protein M406DRAFT_326987 [Cryphonectria parasitica EP155]KAF3768557.1 hypothetical protein M406DRAFT_326987 [Cryphonectria parasitica EP155]